MDSGFYAACTALIARTQALDSVANNLANVNTTGYRAQRDMFRSVVANYSGQSLSELNQATNEYGVLRDTNLDLTQGALEATGNPLDVALEGKGFFVVQTANGRYFTRNGSFQVSRQGQLITSQGDPVMGENGPVRIVGNSVNVSQDGTISVDGAVTGKLKIVSFAPGTAVESLGNNYYKAPTGSEQVDSETKVAQGMLEGSNVNPVAAAVELINVQRTADLMQRALSIFHTDFNRVATDELPRVSS